MVKYVLAAVALKIFSLNNISKKAYRKIGNVFEDKTRGKAKNINSYISRGNLLISLCKKYGVINEGDELLEIGTGWMHWYSIYLRLFYNVKITMLDIWDNRQLGTLKAAFSKVSEMSKELAEHNQFIEDIDKIIHISGFEELYDKLDLNYVIEERGSLNQFTTNSFDFIFSFHVLEHVPKENTKELANNIYRTLKPGGFSIHQIGIDDHLSHYDKSESSKNYLRYSDSMWKRVFENEVQYFNRLQMSDWLDIFDRKGFVLMEKIMESKNIDSLKIDSKYQHYTKEDLGCTILTIVHKKPNK